MEKDRKEQALRNALAMSQQHKKGGALLENKTLNTEDVRIVVEYIMSPQASSLKRLWLGGNIIGDQGGEMICNALNSSTFCVLEGLTLNNTKIGINTLRAMGEYLLSPHSDRLIYLNLSSNSSIGYNNGITILTSALAHNTILTCLDIDDCRIGERGGKQLEFLLSNYNATICNLGITNNDISDKLRNRVLAISKLRNRSRILSPPPYQFYTTNDNANENTNNISQSDLSKLETLMISVIRPLGNEIQTLRNIVETQNNTIANLQSEINLQKTQIADLQQNIVTNMSTNISLLGAQLPSRSTTTTGSTQYSYLNNNYF